MVLLESFGWQWNHPSPRVHSWVADIHGSDWATYRWSSPGGDSLGLEHGEQVELCETHADEFMDAFEAELDDEPHEFPRLRYLDEVYEGDVEAYMLEHNAVRDSQPDTEYGRLLVAEREVGGPSKRNLYVAIKIWLEDDKAVRNEGTPEIDFEEVLEETPAFPNSVRTLALD